MELIQGKHLSDMIEYFKQNFRQDPNGVAAVGTLCHPVVSLFAQVFVNSQNPVNCTLMVTKIPVIEDLLAFYSHDSCKSTTVPDQESTNELPQHAAQFNRFFYQFWCKDLDNVTSIDIANILQIYIPKAPICKTPKLLAQLVLDRCGCKMENYIVTYPNILSNTEYLNVQHETDQGFRFDQENYKIGIVTLEEFETQILPLYHPYRYHLLRSSIVFKLNCGIYYKKTSQLVGWAFFSAMGQLNALHVVPQHRGKKLAIALVERIVRLCEKFDIIPLGFAKDPKKSYLATIGFQIYPDLEFVYVLSMTELENAY